MIGLEGFGMDWKVVEWIGRLWNELEGCGMDWKVVECIGRLWNGFV